MRSAKSLRRVLVLALAVGGATGCTGTTGHLALATTRPLDPRRVALDARAVRLRRHVVGRSCIKVVGIVPLAMPKIGDALEDALRRTGTDRLSNVVVGYEVFDIPLIYGVACYVVEGDAW